jgi:hypothetical protein
MTRKQKKLFRLGDLFVDLASALDNGLPLNYLAGVDDQKVTEFYTVLLHAMMTRPGEPKFAGHGIQVHRGEGAPFQTGCIRDRASTNVPPSQILYLEKHILHASCQGSLRISQTKWRLT